MISAQPDTRSNETIVDALTHDPQAYSLSLGCHGCHHFAACGGLCVKDSLFDCLGLCCNKPDKCTRVCRNAPSVRFADQLREIDGFDFDSVPRAALVRHQISDDIVPLVYHGSSRVGQLSGSTFALRLPDVVSFRGRRLKFQDRATLCAAYHIPEDARIILSGVHQDHRIEPWWTLGSDRIHVIKQMRDIGIDMVTTPNFSVVLDQPRTDDMHALKRILIVFEEFARGGIPCALHSHGRTERDFERWGAEIATRTEIETLSYEFTTGPGRRRRRGWHLEQLAGLAAAAGRDIDIVVRGDPEVIDFLRGHFRKVVYLETTAFMKTLKRQRAERDGNDALRWLPSPTEPGDPLDGLFFHNLRERVTLLRALHYAG
ncbi:hypothetical protein CI1B_27670 [Bradyrhizobium ivorense]|uniref:DUF4417 domain-containing protein n=1 Tax=Bradyrhizobium ivorense TaxID=2511166 RepID=A0A508T5Z1_9BRAD|nr:hypothetical protein CI1B_27670 [Bradyrhizobium ivorense]VIO71307.1 hypothetical protein CI41S_29780 [Bradyrhizobium ivorense]